MIWTSKSGEINKYVQLLLKGKLPIKTILFAEFIEPFIWQGVKKDIISLEWANRQQIDTISAESAGGTVVISPGTIAMVKIDRTEKDVRQFINECYQLTQDQLRQLNIQIEIKNNDLILTNGDRKFGAFTLKELPNKTWFACVMINIQVNKKLIQKTCKQQKREPAGLNEYGLTSAQVKQWFKDYWKDEKWILKD